MFKLHKAELTELVVYLAHMTSSQSGAEKANWSYEPSQTRKTAVMNNLNKLKVIDT